MTQDRASDRNSIQVIARAGKVLRLLSEEDALSLSQIAERTGLARSTIQRIVRALGDEDFVEVNSRRGGVTLGRGLLLLASKALVDVAHIAQPFIRQLAAEVDETVDLSMLRGRTATFIEHVAGSHRLAALSAVGTQFPLHSTANGKAMLACLPVEQQSELLGDTLSADTPATITDKTELLAHVGTIGSGFAYDLEEHTEGVCAIGAAFFDMSGHPYAISIPVPRQRFDAKRALLQRPLAACRDELVAKIGGSLPA